MKSPLPGRRTGLFLSLFLSVASHAVSAVTEDAVIVTATRTAQTVDDSLVAVSVITREAIETSQARDVIELLRLEAGVDVTRYGGPGTGTSVFLRGTDSDQLLVLIDGVRAASATTGSLAWAKLALADVERIEIVRGPNASLYGSDAIGGVIQIFTRRNRTAYVRGQVGSYEDKAFEAGFGGGRQVRYSLNVNARALEGFTAKDADPDNDGFRQRSLSGSLRFGLGARSEATLQGWYSAGHAEYDSGSNDSTNGTLNLRIEQATTNAWQQTLSLGWAADDLDTQSSRPSFIHTRRWTLDWQHDLTLNASALLTLGLNAIRDRAYNIDNRDGTTVFDESTDVDAAFALLQTAIGRHDLQFSARLDDYSHFGSQTTGQAAWGSDVTENLRLTAAVGTAFRAPTLNELYHPGYDYSGVFYYAGNPDLKPETALNRELGLRYRPGPHHLLSVSLYRNTIDNLVAYQGTNSQAINVARARIDGLELSYRLQRGRWSAQTALTLQRPVDTQTGADLLRRPREKFALQLRRKTEHGGHLGLEWLYAGRRHDYGGVILDAYHLLNLSARARLEKNLWLEGRVENLLSADYELVSGYNTPGLSAYLGVKLEFDPR